MSTADLPPEAVTDQAVTDQAVADQAVADQAVPDDAWRRVHPVTPALRGWKTIVGVVAVVAVYSQDNLGQLVDLLGGRRWLLALGVLGVIAVVAFAYSVVAWRMTRYALTDDAVHLRTGVLWRQQRRARLDRLQAVDIVQPLLARLVGLAELRLEVAGGAGSAVVLAYLPEADADRLRAELLARAAGLRAAGAAQADEPAPVAPERLLVDVPIGRVVAGTLRSGTTVVGVLILAGVAASSVLTDGLSVAAVLPLVLGFGSFWWTRLTREANFRLAQSPDGIRVRAGLLEARAQTVPPGRVQAVRLQQGLLWRSPDWWRVTVNVAGYAGNGQQTERTTVLLPVGTRDEALLALWLVLPDLGVEDPRAMLERALSGAGPDGGFTTSPRPARWLDPLGWRRRGVVVTVRGLVIRSGALTRTLVVVPHERTQSLGLQQGPVQRRLGLASMVVHSTPGPVVPQVAHLAADVTARLLDEQAARARHARAGAGPEQWMRRDPEPA